MVWSSHLWIRNIIFQKPMPNRLGVLIIILIAASLVLVLVLNRETNLSGGPVYNFSPKAQDTAQKTQVPTEPNLVPPTGDIDDATKALLLDASVDEADFATEETDADLVGADGTAIGDFGQSYNENEL